MTSALSGSCLCGACSFTATPQGDAGVCHCGMCRKWSGGMFIAIGCNGTVQFTDTSVITRFKSSEWGERVFCSRCGSNLAWLAADGSASAVSIHCFDHPGQFNVTSQIFIDRKPENYALANATAVMTEAEVFAKFAPSTAAKPAPSTESNA